MITPQHYVGPHADSPDWTPERQDNARRLLSACAALEVEMARGGVAFPDNPKTHNGVSGITFGGFRPQDCPQGAKTSSHKDGMGVDRYDPRGEIDAWCMAHQNRLAVYGIYIEHPDATPGWSHWTIRPPKSGKQVFLSMIASMYIRLAAALAIAVLLFGAWQYVDGRGYTRAAAEYTTAINAQKAKAAALLASETAKTRNAEQALQSHLNTQNLKDANHVKTLADLSDRLRRAAGPAGRLRDPHAAGCGAGGGGAPGAATAAASDRPTDPAQTGGLLSAAASEFLLTLARDADAINAAYASCRADSYAVRR